MILQPDKSGGIFWVFDKTVGQRVDGKPRFFILPLNRLVLVVILCAYPGLHLTAQSNTAGTKEKYKDFCLFLAEDGGRWETHNPAYDSTIEYSAKTFEMAYRWDEEREVLWTDVIIHFKKIDYTSQTGLHRWHPLEKRIEYLSFLYEGGFIKGVTEFVNDSSFVTSFVTFKSDGTSVRMKDEYTIISEDTQLNIPYEFTNNTWKNLGTYNWTRIPEQKNQN